MTPQQEEFLAELREFTPRAMFEKLSLLVTRIITKEVVVPNRLPDSV
jgi:hypothetical protein